MAFVHVFASLGRFRSEEELRAFVDQTYTEDGDGIPSPFMREVGLEDHEPGCIEVIRADRGIPLAELLTDASYSARWLRELDGTRLADAVVCVFEPNTVLYPNRCSMNYCGLFRYEP